MEEIALQDEPQETEPRKPFLSEKGWVLYVYVPVFTLVGIAAGAVLPVKSGFPEVLNLVFGMGLNIFAFAWCRIDSRKRGYELHRLFPYAIVLFGDFALIYYLFRSRQFLDGLKSFGWFILYVVVLLITTTIIVFVVVISYAIIHVLTSGLH